MKQLSRQDLPVLIDHAIFFAGRNGSFGHTFAPVMLAKYNPFEQKRVIALSADAPCRWIVENCASLGQTE